jgi:hypothetical protein
VQRIFPVAGLVILLCGCGSGSSAPPTTVALKTYSDATFHFSFKYPNTWSVPKQGGHESTSPSGVKTYILPITVPGGAAGLEVTVDGNVFQIPTFSDGKIAPDPSGGPDFYHYYHATVSSRPAMRVERWSGKNMDEVDTLANTSKYSYDIRMDTGSPPFPAGVTAAYATIVTTMKLPF